MDFLFYLSKVTVQIEENEGCLDTGFLSVPHLLDTLSEHGHLDAAYRLLYQDKCPSWLYELKRGATTIWESWGAIDENGEPKACSYNHYAFVSVGDWMYRNIGGLRPAKPGYKEFVIQPRPDVALTSADISYRSLYGEIRAVWRKKGGRFVLDCTVPVNTRCQVLLPDGTKKECGSGMYHMEAELEKCEMPIV